MAFLLCLKKEKWKMEYILAIAFVETVMLEMKFKKEKEKLTIESLENNLNTLLDKKKEIIIAYAKIALDNIKNSGKEITVREMEAQIQILKDEQTTEKLIERAKRL